MKKKNIRNILLILISLMCAVLGLLIISSKRNEQLGEDKFRIAIAELRMDKQFDNPCLGASVLRKFTYSDLSEKSIDEIKAIAKIDFGSC